MIYAHVLEHNGEVIILTALDLYGINTYCGFIQRWNLFNAVYISVL